MILVVAIAIVLMVLGFEMFIVLGISTIAAKELFFSSIPDLVLVQKLVGGINHTTLLAIPFFVFAAHLMASGQIARRLTGVVKSGVGHFRGGMGHTVVGGSMAFGSVSGSAPATVAALGRLMYPELRNAGYSEKFSLGLIVSSAETALLIPPSITLIIYGWMTGTSITGLFAGGLAVGLVLGLAFGALVVLETYISDVKRIPRPSLKSVISDIKSSAWALGMPVLILGGIYSGYFTATEAAAVSVVYAIVIEGLIYRELNFKKLVAVTENSAIATSVIFILLAFGGVLSFFITLAEVPALIGDWMDNVGGNPLLFLLIINVIFLIAGMFIDPNSALLILVPPLYPVAIALGIDPIHFGIIVTLNICVGMITPPFGLDIFVASSTLNKPVMTIINGVWPFLVVNIIVLGLITYIPGVSMFIPNLIAN